MTKLTLHLLGPPSVALDGEGVDQAAQGWLS